MFNVLFIDDEPHSVETAKKWLKEQLGIEELVISFSEAENSIKKFQPDMIVLDLLDGPPDSAIQNWEGAFEKIRKIRFCPIIIYSAHPDLFTPKHPLIEKVQKGKTGSTDLEKKILFLKPYVDGIREVKASIDSHLANVLRDISPYVFKNYTGSEEQKNALLGYGRRRLASFMDDESRIGSVLDARERYLYPPISNNLKLGDVLRRKAGNALDPNEFRLVLTPSCDLATTPARPPKPVRLAKVKRVLVALCHPPKFIIDKLGLHSLTDDVLKDRLHTLLTQGFEKRVFPLPSLDGKIPLMIADLKDLDLIPIGNIGDEENTEQTEYVRIASVDSPFKELVSWAFMSDASRPGMPDCDFDKWSEEIMTILSAGHGAS